VMTVVEYRMSYVVAVPVLPSSPGAVQFNVTEFEVASGAINSADALLGANSADTISSIGITIWGRPGKIRYKQPVTPIVISLISNLDIPCSHWLQL